MGIVWLATLGKVTMDWKEMSMVFKQGDKMVKLMGNSSEDRSATFQSLISPATLVEGCCWSSTIEVA
ncbi:hypothetical protein A2U01_0066362, partial [Trifolium medium]|nr:hypothetical protein [Trifolium medium]